MFLYKYGKKIFDKIQEAMQPEFADEEAINPFDFWKGANFKLKVRKVAGFINYDKSEFDSISALYDGDDAKLEEFWKTEYALNEFTDPTNFKSYDELKKRLLDVIGSDIRRTDIPEAPTAESTTFNDKESSETRNEGTQEDTDALTYFERLAKE